jgi:hypothetical protein
MKKISSRETRSKIPRQPPLKYKGGSEITSHRDEMAYSRVQIMKKCITVENKTAILRTSQEEISSL